MTIKLLRRLRSSCSPTLLSVAPFAYKLGQLSDTKFDCNEFEAGQFRNNTTVFLTDLIVEVLGLRSASNSANTQLVDDERSLQLNEIISIHSSVAVALFILSSAGS